MNLCVTTNSTADMQQQKLWASQAVCPAFQWLLKDSVELAFWKHTWGFVPACVRLYTSTWLRFTGFCIAICYIHTYSIHVYIVRTLFVHDFVYALLLLHFRTSCIIQRGVYFIVTEHYCHSHHKNSSSTWICVNHPCIALTQLRFVSSPQE